MKKVYLAALLAFITSLATAQNGVTFVVDEGLAPVDNKFGMEKYLNSGSGAIYGIFRDEGVPGDTHAMIARSFSDDEKFYTFTGKDPFFKTIVQGILIEKRKRPKT